VLFFGLNTRVLTVALAGITFGATVTGLLVGRTVQGRSEILREPFGILQGALISFMGLVLAFGLSLAVGHYESRRADVVLEANTIGTTYLRAQTLAEPIRSDSLMLLRRYHPDQHPHRRHGARQPAQERAVADSGEYQNRLEGARRTGPPPATFGQGLLTVLVAAAVVTLLLVVTFDCSSSPSTSTGPPAASSRSRRPRSSP
jgi:hypothetical protein